jgi:hypothetical protein
VFIYLHILYHISCNMSLTALGNVGIFS